METVALKLADSGIATMRYQFPYMEKRIKRPDSETVLTDTVRAAMAAAKKIAGDLPLFAGGKSMGGRMTSLAAARQSLDGVRGMIFFGFPLHAAGKPGAERGAHLADVEVPMLFLQGSRDALADLKLLKPLCSKIADRAELFVVKGGDHSFHVLKSLGQPMTKCWTMLLKRPRSGWGRIREPFKVRGSRILSFEGLWPIQNHSHFVRTRLELLNVEQV